MNKNKGFTLIELLVVIAIIGILSSVVLASLNTARNKGSDTAIKNNLANIRAQAELHYDNTGTGGGAGTYTGLCTQPTIAQMLESARSAAGLTGAVVTTLATPGSTVLGVCHVTATDWAVSMPLKTNSANSWCVDSTGASKSTTFLGANAVKCT